MRMRTICTLAAIAFATATFVNSAPAQTATRTYGVAATETAVDREDKCRFLGAIQGRVETRALVDLIGLTQWINVPTQLWGGKSVADLLGTNDVASLLSDPPQMSCSDPGHIG
jgi:hypothetical protein